MRLIKIQGASVHKIHNMLFSNKIHNMLNLYSLYDMKILIGSFNGIK
jgi:hypothetical protein